MRRPVRISVGWAVMALLWASAASAQAPAPQPEGSKGTAPQQSLPPAPAARSKIQALEPRRVRVRAPLLSQSLTTTLYRMRLSMQILAPVPLSVANGAGVPLKFKARLILDASGRLSAFTEVKASGHAPFDQAVRARLITLKAVKAAGALTVPTEKTLRTQALEKGIEVIIDGEQPAWRRTGQRAAERPKPDGVDPPGK